MIRCTVFDFDGVILASNSVKDQAYDQAVEACFPGNVDIVRTVLCRGRPLTRAQTMAQIVERLVACGRLPAAAADRAVADLVAAYGRYVDAGLLAASPLPGVPCVLEILAARMPLYLNTLNPRDRLAVVLERRGLAGYFREVLGSESSKIDNLASIVARHGPAGDIVVVGDGVLDWESSRCHGTAFVAVNMCADDLAEYPAAAHVADLVELPQIIAGL